MKRLNKPIVIMLDSDATPHAIELAQACMQFTDTRIAIPKSDPGNNSTLENCVLINNAGSVLDILLKPITEAKF